MRNCSRCTRWRPLADYGAAESCGELADACAPCRRAEAPPRQATEPQLFPDGRYATRNRTKVEAGSHVWAAAVAPWLRGKADEYGWEQLALWAECSDKTLRRVTTGEWEVVDVGIIDRLVTREGSTSLAELCPLAA